MTRSSERIGLALAASALVVVLTAGLAVETRQVPAPPPTAPSTFVIVHGAWGGGWAWRGVETRLRERGHDVRRATLTGLGERVHLAGAGIGLETHIEDVANLIRFEDLRDVVLVGHSYGGMVITGVADRVGDRIRRLVYVDAFVPGDGDSLLSLVGEGEGWLKQMTQGDFVVPAWVKPGQAVPHDVPHPLRTLTDRLALTERRGAELPATYILTVDAGKTDDAFSPQAERARTRGWTVIQMTADHNPQWSAPDELVDLLVRERCPCE